MRLSSRRSNVCLKIAGGISGNTMICQNKGSKRESGPHVVDFEENYLFDSAWTGDFTMLIESTKELLNWQFAACVKR